MNFISNDYSVRAPPVTIVPSSAGSTVLDVQPDPSLRTIGRSTASRSTTVSARPADSQQHPPAEGSDDRVSSERTRPRGSVDLYRSVQQNTASGSQFRRIDLYA